MWYVLFSVICSVTVSVILKMGKRKGFKHLHLIVWNYPVAAAATFFLLSPEFPDIPVRDLPWGLYSALAVLLPVIFICIAYAIEFSGIVKTEVAQRLSLFIPLMAAFFIFHEDIGSGKLIGIAVGLLAIVCSIGWNKQRDNTSSSGKWLFPALVFVGMGIIDILFKKVALYQETSYAFSMFVIFILAMFVATGMLLYKVWRYKEVIKKGTMVWGIALGLFNFGNILFYMKAHRALPESPSVVFTGMNIGVIVVGALVGLAFFKENLTLLNKVGLALALVAVLIIAYL
ncbi:EamA family transporter [Sphingobacterium sp. SGG-5]|uniref:EamA family transporter n=1 Tax=Sphingobacterium sp. SGG-5 TaxID=2710881 RepID=UPI0013EBC747|nr:EamA family transporter [Sphingobacterium sp. SGG-5]NGM61363.1 EamA family transporter [Sphingobacterium sp. SGG-5]